MSTPHCINCGNTLQGNEKFCAQCGQKTKIHRITWHDILHDALHYVTHSDKGIFFVLKQLYTRPGTLIREYIAGKRKKYMSPVTLLLICAGLSYLSINAFDLGEVNMRNMPAPETLEFSSEASKERYIQRYDRAYQFNMFINKNSKLVTLSATPLLALLYWLLFLKARFNYFEHLVACMFSNSATSLVYALILMPIVSLMGGGMIYLVVTFLFLVGETIYRAWCYYGMMGYHGWKKAIKVFFYSLVVTGVWSLFSAGMGFLFISGFFS